MRISDWSSDVCSSDLSGGLAEIIVTAQRREETTMSVPISIQAMSGDQLAAAGISEMSGLQSTTPGYVADSNFGFIQPYIHGIGNAIFLGADSSVATFVDDVPQIDGDRKSKRLNSSP